LTPNKHTHAPPPPTHFCFCLFSCSHFVPIRFSYGSSSSQVVPSRSSQ
jgi:hypothetical protein